MSEVTQILSAIELGDISAAQRLFPLIYDELRRLAKMQLANEPVGQTLQATALVHEAYLRLLGDGEQSQRWDNVGHFFGAAAQAMRRILVENARRKQRLKYGRDFARLEYEEIAVDPDVDRGNMIALDEALTKLAATDQASADLIQLRYFAGLSIEQAAKSLRLTPRKASRLCAFARAWLHREISRAQ